MKNKIYLGLVMIALTVLSACDNGNTDVELVDIAPSVSFGASSGLIEGETFTLQVSATDGVDQFAVSELAQANWTISGGGGSGSATLSGNSADFTVSQAGLAAGDYSITVTVTDSNGNSTDGSTDFTIVAAVPDITGTWVFKPADGSLRVGPAPLDGQWFSVNAGDPARVCQYDDEWTFNADGTFTISHGGDTFVEDWQGGGFACGAPVAPFVDGSFQYSFDGFTFTVNGVGAYLGLNKVTNDGELGTHLAADAAPSSVSYNVESASETEIVLTIETVPGVFWTYVYAKK